MTPLPYSKTHTSLLVTLLTAGFIILLTAFWIQRRDLTQLRKAYGQLQEQPVDPPSQPTGSDEARAGASRVAESGVAESGGVASRVIATGIEGTRVADAHAEATRAAEPGAEDAVQPHPTLPPEPVPNKLVLAGTDVNRVSGGLVASMRFTPTQTGPLGLLALVVRVPRDSAVRVLDLTPIGSATYADFSKTISDDGKFAFFQGTLGDEADIAFDLTVSNPGTVNVRGTCGIGEFPLAITPVSATPSN